MCGNDWKQTESRPANLNRRNWSKEPQPGPSQLPSAGVISGHSNPHQNTRTSKAGQTPRSACILILTLERRDPGPQRTTDKRDSPRKQSQIGNFQTDGPSSSPLCSGPESSPRVQADSDESDGPATTTSPSLLSPNGSFFPPLPVPSPLQCTQCLEVDDVLSASWNVVTLLRRKEPRCVTTMRSKKTERSLSPSGSLKDIKGKRDTMIKISPKFLLIYFNSKEFKPEELM